jgi:hypothetical protein
MWNQAARIMLNKKPRTILVYGTLLILITAFLLVFKYLGSNSRSSPVPIDMTVALARWQCSRLAHLAHMFDQIEPSPIREIDELQGKYLLADGGFLDPWGSQYQIDTNECYIFSMGPDKKKHEMSRPGYEADDIIAFYGNDLRIVDASLKIDAGPSFTSPSDRMDRLSLVFDEEVNISWCRHIAITGTSAVLLVGDDLKLLNPAARVFFWYEKVDSRSGRLSDTTELFTQGQVVKVSADPENRYRIVFDISEHRKSRLEAGILRIAAGPLVSKIISAAHGTPDPNFDRTFGFTLRSSNAGCAIRRE